MLRDLDREIATTRAHLESLETARRAVAKTVPAERPGLAKVAETDPELPMSALVARIMGDGKAWGVTEVVEALASEGVRAARPTINSLLYRSAKRPDGPFESVGRGQYRLRHEPNGSSKGKAESEGALPVN